MSNDDIYHGLGEADLVSGDKINESPVLAGYDDAGYFSIISVEIAEIEGERHFEIQEGKSFINLSERQVRVVRERMEDA